MADLETMVRNDGTGQMQYFVQDQLSQSIHNEQSTWSASLQFALNMLELQIMEKIKPTQPENKDKGQMFKNYEKQMNMKYGRNKIEISKDGMWRLQ